MKEETKKRQLFLYKAFATGLFILMLLIFVSMLLLQKHHSSHWIGYIRAFSEAAMVGALADWFAVTALFNYPLGIKIPHTNLIENSKNRIGDNLGQFVVENFLSPENIKPYIKKIKISSFVGDWLSKEKNQTVLVEQVSEILLNIIKNLEDKSVVNFISAKAKEMSEDFKINLLIGNGLEYLLEKNEHQKLIDYLSKQIKEYILVNKDLVKERVKKESFSLIPKFVDDKIAAKITSGLASYFEEVEQDENHELRKEITSKLLDFSKDLQVNSRWNEEFKTLKSSFLNEEKLNKYSEDIWFSIKKSLTNELTSDESTLKNYLIKNINTFSENLLNDEAFQTKINSWVQFTSYKYILKNSHQFGELISSTVGNWQGRELSEKLELEVGKDLQFIRVNGTLVGGLVGLIIYTIANFLA
ncbi:DUF445 domain-containing protein [Halpernia sp.]|uniref:DUF445 domain-containing protein n=1 Tax=Halpernia sp. TaxID=2782209 RepID=UPI003A8FAE57